MEPSRRDQVIEPAGGIDADVVDGPDQPLLAADAVVGEKERHQDDDRDDSGDGEVAPQSSTCGSPRLWPDEERDDEGGRDEHHRVVRAQRLEDEHRRQQRRSARARAGENPIERGKRDRKELHVQRLQVREANQLMRVEAVQAAGDDAGKRAAGPPLHRDRHREAGQCEANPDQQVVDEHRRQAGPLERRADDRRDNHVLREGQRVGRRMEDRRAEEMRRVARQLMRHPRDHPGVERGVVVVEPRQVRGIARERPGVQRRQRREQR